MKVKEIIVNGKVVKGYEIPLQNAVLVLIVGERGYIMCGYLNLDVAEKFGDCACIVRGVKSVDDMLNSSVVEVTSKAGELGIFVGMPVRDVIRLIC